MNYMEQTLGEGEKPYIRGQTHATWGHLAPKPDTIYRGYILFTHTCHGCIEIIDYEFRTDEGQDLDGSPWIYEDLNEFVGDLVHPERAIECRLPRGRVYIFHGTYTRTADKPRDDCSDMMEEGKGEFKGRVRRLRIDTRKHPPARG